MTLGQMLTAWLPVKGTTRNVLPLVRSKSWEAPNQRCSEESKAGVSRLGPSSPQGSGAQVSRASRTPESVM